MVETKVVAFTERCDMLIQMGIPFDTYWVGDVCYFIFPNDLALREALDLFGI